MRIMTIKDLRNILDDPENNIHNDSVITHLEMNVNSRFITADYRKVSLNTEIRKHNLSTNEVLMKRVPIYTVNSSMTFDISGDLLDEN